jgi:type IV secretion system protein VirB5
VKMRTIYSCFLVLLACLSLSRPASAQWVVTDPAALTQLLVQVQKISQEISLAERTLTQAQQAYNAMSGNRGMGNLLSGVNRNYLPATWAQLNSAMGGGGGPYAPLGTDVTATVNRNAVLTNSQTGQLAADELDSITQRREAVALLESLSRAAIANSSDRFASIQTLINAMASTSDQKGILELHTRVGAELGMLQNEQTKLGNLYQAALVAAQTEQERSDEKAMADIGHLRNLPAMGLVTGAN